MYMSFKQIWCITNFRGSWGIFGDSSVTLAQWWRARDSTILVNRRSPVRFRPKTRQLRFTWIWANRPSSKGSKLLFPVIKANQTHHTHTHARTHTLSHSLTHSDHLSLYQSLALSPCTFLRPHNPTTHHIYTHIRQVMWTTSKNDRLSVRSNAY